MAQSWAAGNDIHLCLGEKAAPYDYFLFATDFGLFRFRYFHSFLEHIENYNRYLTGRGLEYTNRNDFVISISEIVVYTGENRPMDFSYFNPLATHLEVELNNKQNRLGVFSGNGVWQLSLDYKANDEIRISGNFLIDELVIDKIQKDEGKTNGLASSFSIVWTNERKNMNVFFSLLQVGSKTFRHGDGYNNFINRNNPLGWEYGSDSDEYKIGINWYHISKAVINLSLGMRRIGSESIIYNSYHPYDNYLVSSFPSGDVKKSHFLSNSIFWNVSPSINLKFDIIIGRTNNGDYLNELKLGFDFFIINDFTLNN